VEPAQAQPPPQSQPPQPQAPQSQPGSSPESKAKHKKLQKDKPPSAGFRHMFGRKNRESKLPDNAAEALNGGQSGGAQAGGASLGRRLSGFRRKNPPNFVPEPAAAPAPAPAPVPAATPTYPSTPTPARTSEDDRTPVPSPRQHYDRSYDPSIRDSLSRVDSNEEEEAHQAFSSFDQGPLEDVPAFVPQDTPTTQSDDDDDADSAEPPTISRTRPDEKEASPSEAIPVHDRWAQIRKNAAERAAQRQTEEQKGGGPVPRAERDDGDTSGEETIESRVARIKARVAELTGNMEGGGSPGSRSPVRRP